MKKFIKYIGIRGIGMLMFFTLFNLMIGTFFYREFYRVRSNMYALFNNPDYDYALSQQMHSLQMMSLMLF